MRMTVYPRDWDSYSDDKKRFIERELAKLKEPEEFDESDREHWRTIAVLLGLRPAYISTEGSR